MPDLDRVSDKQFVFGIMLLVANKLDTLLERALVPNGLTTVQWFMLVVCGSLFDQPPTIKELARTLSTSHQNIKQVALRLSEKGLLELKKDDRDRRVTRVCLTDACRRILSDIETRGADFVGLVLNGISPADLATTRRVLGNIQGNIVAMEQRKQK